MDLFRHADPLVKADEIGAAAEQHVLTIVDDLVDPGMKIGGRASAEGPAPLQKLHAEPGLRQRAGSAHARYTAADDCDGT